MNSMELAIMRAKALGNKEILEFPGVIRSEEVGALTVGDTFTISDSPRIFECRIGQVRSVYTFVLVNDKEVKRLFPSIFTRRVARYNSDGTFTGEWIYTNGTAVDLFRQFSTVAEGMQALLGKTLHITKGEQVLTRRPFTDSLTHKWIYTIDIIN